TFDIVAVVTANHIHVELHLDLFGRHQWKVCVVARAVQTGLFAGVPDENHGAFRLWPGGEGFSNGHLRGAAGSVVVGSIIDDVALIERNRIGRLRGSAAAAGSA